jgi:glycosyltransferase involved in cell wall biosynthesis
MELSVVVPTLNACDKLATCLDALTEETPDAEIIVVNGPSADGTTGMVQDRDDIDLLVEIADRSVNTARNAGIDRATGDWIAFVSHTQRVAAGWRDAIANGLDGSDAVTGPTKSLDGENDEIEQRTIAGREVTYFNPGNVAFRRDPLDELDGFDEYLEIGGARDFAHRFAAGGFETHWDDNMCVRQELTADGGEPETDWGWKYRSLAYRLVKNYNLRPTVVRRLLSHAGTDGYHSLREAIRGEKEPSWWLGTGRAVLSGLVGGLKDGLAARRHDGSPRRNPSGRSARADRAVTVYDWR